MSREPIRITREELHRLVWSRTLRRVAEELGTSYVELVKACTTMNVPRPPNGYWARLSLGLPVEQIQLPEAGLGTPTQATLQPQLSRAELRRSWSRLRS